MNEPWKHSAKWNNPDGKEHILYNFIYMRELQQANSETESKTDYQWLWGEGMGSYHFLCRVSVWD